MLDPEYKTVEDLNRIGVGLDQVLAASKAQQRDEQPGQEVANIASVWANLERVPQPTACVTC